jgi:hypothetical protein
MEGNNMSEEYRLDKPAALTCPECGGALERQQDGTLLRALNAPAGLLRMLHGAI